MLIAQITDCHIVSRGTLCSGVIPTNDMLHAAITRINHHKPSIDVILATGDLTDHGSMEEYEALSTILAKVKIPTYLIPGNHDNPKNLKAIFANHSYLPKDGHLSYIIDDYPVALIGLDTTVEGSPGGQISIERLSWLRQALTKTREKPTIIFLHHPPFQTGIWWMDAIGLKGGREAEKLVKEFDHVEAVLAGHVHRPIHKRWGNTVASVAPSTAHQLMLDLNDTNFLAMTHEPAAFSLHKWHKKTGLVSHTCYVKDPEKFVPHDHATLENLSSVRTYFEKAYSGMLKEYD